MTTSTRGRRFPSQVLTDQEVRGLIRASRPDCYTGRRNRALIGLLYRTGLRISEALDLYPRDLDAVAGTVFVARGKGGKARLVGMDEGPFKLVAAWEALRPKLGLDGSHRLFCTLGGGALSQAYIRRMLPRLARRAGIEKRVHAHAFRHTFAYELVDEGVDVVTISKLLGHQSIVVTATYLDHVNPKAAVRAASQRSWLVGKLAR